jgi:cytochrome P450
LVETLRRAAEEVLRLAAPVRVLARAAKSIATNSHRYISITT